MNSEVGPGSVATNTGVLVGTSSIAVVLNPSSVASPGASGPNEDGRFCTRAFGAGASGSSGSVLPSRSALKGSGTVPEPGSTTTCAAGVLVVTGAMANVVMAAISVLGNAADATWKGLGAGGAGLGSE